MDKFGRNYSLSVTTQDPDTLERGLLLIQLPLTIEFDITRRTLSTASTASIRIYNLSQKNRNNIRFNVSDIGNFRQVTLQAGYGDNLSTVFSGNISRAWSVREGVNFVTTIECFDGGFSYNNSTTELSVPAGTSRKTVLTSLIGDLDFVSLGAVGPSFYTDPKTGSFLSLPLGNTLNGDTTALLKEYTNGGFFIDLGVAHCLSNNEYIIGADPTLTIDSDSGLLGTPVLEETIVHFDMLFEPQLKPGYSVFLNSITEDNFNGRYRVTGVHHRGMISDAVCGEVITTGEFFYNKILEGVPLS